MNATIESIQTSFASAYRFRWWCVSAAWLLAVFGWGLVLMIPNRYDSEAEIYVDTSSILKPLLQGLAIDPNVAGEADMVRRALLARPNLEKVANSTGMFKNAKTPQERDAVIAKLSDSLVIEGDSRTNVYRVRYSSNDAARAYAVVANILNTFVSDSLGANRLDTTSAESFLRRQVADYEARLSESEGALADFKKQNVGLMPDESGDYFQRMQAEMATLRQLETNLAVARKQRDELRRKLIGDGGVGGAAAVIPPSDSQIQLATEIDARLQDARKQLDELLLKYTDNHFDVIAMKDTIARLEARRRAELGSVRATSGGISRGGGVEADQVLQSLQIRLNSVDLDVTALQAQVDQARGRVAELKRLVSTGPEVEAELARLSRDYGVTKAQYEALLQRLETARLSDNADKSTEVKFRVLNPARQPDRAAAPNRTLLVIAVLCAAILGGCLISYVIALTKPVFYSEREIAKATGLPVLGVISESVSPSEKKRRSLSAVAAGLIVALLLISGATLSVGASSAAHALRAAMGLEA